MRRPPPRLLPPSSFGLLSVTLVALASGACSGSTSNGSGGPVLSTGGTSAAGASGSGAGGTSVGGQASAGAAGAGGSGGTGSGGAAGSVDSGRWPSLGFDVSSWFYNPSETKLSTGNVGSLTQIWEVDTLGGVTGAPAVADGRVYVVGGATTYALDPATGATIWENADVGGTSAPTFEAGVLYVDATMGGEILYALDAATGKEKWHTVVETHPNAVGWSSPVVAGDLVVLGDSSFEENYKSANATFRGAVVAFDKSTGKEVWRSYTADPPYNGCAVWSTVSVDLASQTVFAVTGNNYTENAGPTSDSVFTFALATGQKQWQYQASTGDIFTILNPKSPDSDFGANPMLIEVGGKKLVALGQKSGTFWAFERATGAVVWQRNLGPGSSVGGIVNNGAYDGKQIYVASNGATSTADGSEPSNGDTVGGGVATLFALDPATGDIAWERQLPAYVWAPITIAGGVGFVAAETRLQAFDVATGKKLYEFAAAGTIASAPVIAGGRVFFGSGMQLVIYGHADTKFHALAVP